jgi:hypothetical protein
LLNKLDVLIGGKKKLTACDKFESVLFFLNIKNVHMVGNMSVSPPGLVRNCRTGADGTKLLRETDFGAM